MNEGISNGEIDESINIEHKYVLLHEEQSKEVLTRLIVEDVVRVPLYTLRETIPWKYEHTIRTALIALDLAQENGVSDEERAILARATLLHDTGFSEKIIELLQKKGEFNKEEREIVKEHVRIAINYCVSHGLEDEADIVARHHELFKEPEDSPRHSYPRNHKDPDIHNGERKKPNPKILHLAEYLAISDRFEGLAATDRPYKKSSNRAEIEQELVKFTGKPELIEQMMSKLQKGSE